MWDVTKGTVQAIVRIFDPEQREQISGVVGSYEITRQAIKFDTRRALAVLAVISLSLAIVNLFHSCRSTAATSSGAWSRRSADTGAVPDHGAVRPHRLPAGDLPVLRRAVERHRAVDRGGFDTSVGAGICSSGDSTRRREWNAPLSTRRRGWMRPRSRGAFVHTARLEPGPGRPPHPRRGAGDQLAEYGEQVDRFALGLRGLA